MWRFSTIIPVQDTDSQQQLPIDAIFKTAENSTVGIITGSNDGPNPEFDGTGFVYDIRGDMLYKVTSAHVVEGFDEVEVSFIDGSTHTAEVKGINPRRYSSSGNYLGCYQSTATAIDPNAPNAVNTNIPPIIPQPTA